MNTEITKFEEDPILLFREKISGSKYEIITYYQEGEIKKILLYDLDNDNTSFYSDIKLNLCSI